ncbi:MAG: maleylpyruvate isomerase family mycothiol-dependent enzyme [Mycobacteriales bacterium]|nr:MAG: hypothetical protein DLM56_06790 [Pseudonocardiales bacterium]
MSSPRDDVVVTTGWMAQGTRLLLGEIDALDDDALAGPSRLPDWTNAQLVAHVARNADALMRLISWARTGVETPMYVSPGARAAEIDRDAARPAEVLRADVHDSAGALAAAIAACTGKDWRRQVRSARGRAMPAADVPWMRVREVWLHAVDLGGGSATMADLPGDLVVTMLDDVAGMYAQRGDAPAVLLTDDDAHSWSFGSGADVADVTGSAADLLGWLTGRSDGSTLQPPGGLPNLPAWL